MTVVYDTIVIGTGGIGSAALYELAKRGSRVLGIDQFPPAHDRGSSHGRTRMIRQAYFEHVDYVPLLLRAYDLWDELERVAGERLFFRCGLVEIGPPQGIVIPGVLQSAQRHRLNVVELSAGECGSRFPQLRRPSDMLAVWEPQAGYLLVEACVAAHLRKARELGADYENAVVHDWTVRGDNVQVQVTGHGGSRTYFADRLIVCGGAWASRLLPEIGVPFRVLRKHLHWCAAQSPMHVRHGCPAFFYETAGGFFYGFPALDDAGVKVGEHSGGEQLPDPDRVPCDVDPRDLQRVMEFVSRCLPFVAPRSTSHATCMYTMTPDENFVVGQHPAYEQVVIAAGLSGHGFKFAPALGQALADLARDGRTSLPIEFLRPDRWRL